jgi:hypothetical protein
MSRFVPLPLAFLSAISFFGASAAEVNRSWEELVRVLKTGNRIIVTRTNSASLEGKLISIDGQSITIAPKSGTQTIERRDVHRVRTARSGHPVLYGTLIGAAAGSVTLWAIDHASSKPRPGEAAGLGLFLGAPAGAIVGAMVPSAATLYEAAEQNSPTRAKSVEAFPPDR